MGFYICSNLFSIWNTGTLTQLCLCYCCFKFASYVIKCQIHCNPKYFIFFNSKRKQFWRFQYPDIKRTRKNISAVQRAYMTCFDFWKKLAIPLLWIRRIIKARCLVEVNSEKYWKAEEKSASLHIFFVKKNKLASFKRTLRVWDLGWHKIILETCRM